MNEHWMLTAFIYLIAELPPPLPITLDKPDQQLLLQLHQLRYRAVSLFLRWIRLGESQSELLLLPEIQGYEPIARFWDSLLILATQVHPKTENELICAFSSPAELWFACLVLGSHDGLAQALTGYPQPRSKKESIKHARVCAKYLNQLDLVDQERISKNLTKQRCPCLTSWLLLQARKIAADEPDFDKRFYRPCLQAFRRAISFANENKDMQLMWLDSESQLFMTKQNRKRPYSTKQ